MQNVSRSASKPAAHSERLVCGQIIQHQVNGNRARELGFDQLHEFQEFRFAMTAVAFANDSTGSYFVSAKERNYPRGGSSRGSDSLGSPVSSARSAGFFLELGFDSFHRHKARSSSEVDTDISPRCRTFSTNIGSVLSLKLFTKCGFKLKARQIRRT